MNLGSDALATAVPMRLRTWRGQSRTSWRQTLLTTLTLGKAMTWSARVQKSKNIFQTSLTNDPKCGFFSPKLWFWGLFFSCFFGFFRKATENLKFYVFFYDFLNFYEFRKILKCCSHKDFQWFSGQIMFLQWIFDTFKNLPKDRKVRPKSRFWSQKYDFWESKMVNF